MTIIAYYYMKLYLAVKNKSHIQFILTGIQKKKKTSKKDNNNDNAKVKFSLNILVSDYSHVFIYVDAFRYTHI